MEKYTLISLNRDIDMTNPYGFRFLKENNVTKATSADRIESGQWCFDNTERCYVFKPPIEDDRTYGYVRFSTNETITGGDVIEVEYDVKNIGFNAKMMSGVTIDILDENDGWTHAYNFVTRDSTNGYITFKDRWIVPLDIIDDRHFAIVVGFVTSPSNIGRQAEMRMRDIKINIIRNGGGIGLDDYVYTGLGIAGYDDSDGVMLTDDPEKPLEGARDITLKSGVYGFKSLDDSVINGNGVLFVLPYRSKSVGTAKLPYIIQLAIINDADLGAGVYRRGYSNAAGWSEWHRLYEKGDPNITMGDARFGTSVISDHANYGISLQDSERSTNYAYLETYHNSQPNGYISGIYVYNQVAKLPVMKFVPKEGESATSKWIMPIHSCIDAPSAPKIGDTPLTAGYMLFNKATNKPMWWGDDSKWHYADGTVAE